MNEQQKNEQRTAEQKTDRMNKKKINAFDCICVTDVQVYPFKECPYMGHIKGIASVVLNDQFLVRGLRVMEGENGMFVGYPIDPFFKGEDMRCIAQPITRKLREHIENCILEKYQEISSQED